MRGFFFFKDTATTEIYTLSLHDALPISLENLGTLADAQKQCRCDFDVYSVDFWCDGKGDLRGAAPERFPGGLEPVRRKRSEEHTSELQSRQYLVCRLLLEKKKSRIH